MNRSLLVLMLAYGIASLIHFAHNAAFLDEYPNMPAWLSPTGVWAAWIGITCLGLGGYALVRRGYELTGLLVIGVYGVLGLDALAHYGIAPMSAHTVTMHLTIWLEAAAGAGLLIAVLIVLLSRNRRALHGG